MRPDLETCPDVRTFAVVAARAPVASASCRCRAALALSCALISTATSLANPIPPSGIPLTPTAIASGGQITTSHGIEFVTIGSPGNAPWMGDGTLNDRAIGRGSVGYEYKIGRFEVTTAQWAEFMNAAFDRPMDDRIPFVQTPSTWGGAQTTPSVPGGRRWNVPAGNELIPAGGISWRTAAIYCNWLHNDKSTDREAFLSGAYDVSTFGTTGQTFSDQATRSIGAKFFIPTWDEWLKAAHYDPNRNGQDQGGWWKYSTTADVIPLVGPPPSWLPGAGIGDDRTGDAETNTGGWWQIYPQFNVFSVPLGSYPTVQSPWGLIDIAGATTEWTEEIFLPGGVPPTRLYDGSWWFDGPVGTDVIGFPAGADFPAVSIFQHGFRIASVIPAPPSAALLALGLGVACSRRRSENARCTEGGTSGRFLPRLCCRPAELPRRT